MRLTVIGLVALGLVAAVCAAVLLAALRAQGSRTTVVDGSKIETEVVVAARDLPAMTVIDGSSLEVRTMPDSEVPAGALRSAEAVVGKVLIAPMLAGQTFQRNAFAREGSGIHLASVLRDGHRAMSVSLQDFSGLDGLLYPGSVVDVIASFRIAEETSEGVRSGDLISTVLLEAIQVLAIEDQTIVSGDQETGETEAPRSGRGRRMITLLVDAKQAEALQLASGHGTIALALRNPLDLGATARRGTSFVDISPVLSNRMEELANASAPESAPPPPTTPEPIAEAEPAEPKQPSWRTVVIRGSTLITQSFDDDDDVVPAPAPALTQRDATSPPPVAPSGPR